MILVDTTPGQSVMASWLIGESDAREAQFLVEALGHRLSSPDHGIRRVQIDASQAHITDEMDWTDVRNLCEQHSVMPLVLESRPVLVAQAA
ncbi:MAG TPA: hypothetical protein PLB31_07375 [Fimbriimonadaceae bacterium]|nr:hypothetical protein [Armatimonadota bacterium]HCM73450.1 hypothetical protein [Armatimonadota bacterium]HRD31059.1 hypothetical protein [Fimbriimonadaceae bacterium]HRE93449.1 hypothetical protein [Fimbriimonadaceae bacterium]HRI74277.1 hypothetical protein [Fimbriimonadaceae bacterium]